MTHVPRGLIRTRFNPTLVRLRLRNGVGVGVTFGVFQSHAGSIEAPFQTILARSICVSFQSHAGSIEAYKWIDVEGLRLDRFNPTLVRLRPCFHTTASNPTLLVSIPRWFD